MTCTHKRMDRHMIYKSIWGQTTATKTQDQIATHAQRNTATPAQRHTAIHAQRHRVGGTNSTNSTSTYQQQYQGGTSNT